MKKSEKEFPFERLGVSLKEMRVSRHESLAEVSGAVEIEIDMLSAIESGTDRPSEDVLLLLISHFAIKEEEASKLWRLAGYTSDRFPAGDDMHTDQDNAAAGNATMVVLPMDLRVVYTDMVHVTVNDYGLVMNFMQTGGPSNKPLAIARVGMSHEHAKSVVEVLRKTLAQLEPKQLPMPKSDADAGSKQD